MLTQGFAPFVGRDTKSGCLISIWLLRAETALNSSRQTTHKYLWFICFLLDKTSSKDNLCSCGDKDEWEQDGGTALE